MSARSVGRRVLAALSLTVAATIVLAGCAGSDAPASGGTGSADGTAPSGELTWAIAGATLSEGHMDPQTSQMDVTAMVQRVVFDSLVFQNADGSFSPWLASAWEVSEDGRSYTFTLRDDVTFTDGEKFDAAAVKANFDRIVAPDTASAQAASMLGGENYAGTTVIDDTTVRVDFHEPYAPFLQAASTPLLGFYSPRVLTESLDKLKAGGPDVTVGTGPYVLSEYTADQEIVYTANPDYAWGPQGQKTPSVQTLRVSLVPEPSVRTGMANSGEAQLVSELPPSSVAELNPDLTVDTKAYPGMPYSLFLNEKYGVFADQKVRQAFELGIDVDSAVESIFDGQFERAWSVLGPTTPMYDAAIEGTWAFDPKKAEALLDEAGWTGRDADGYRTKDGKRLSARWIAWTPIPDDRTALGNAIQSDLKKIGFEVVREALEPGAYNEQYGPKTYDITDWGFSGVDPDYLRSHLATDGFQNASQVSDPAVDALVAKGAETVDPTERAAVYTELQEWNAQHVAIVPLYVPALISASAPSVSGLTFDLYGRPLFYDASID
ncbi:ABC transporter substrate-binding protein [Microbacterium nymphoidis]|uniref:ABC transporter substrate-binding protein n=1 Tax=Microbacterium nymphoidis TaxID=2898586 RepID=UPI001E6461EA|nr:ABC transporter substrate-binding protein [Microbacterium nymphoidis]MCD2497225.1 ABC transporter substrate-binding protein [Microbacterium nymphoidis]